MTKARSQSMELGTSDLKKRRALKKGLEKPEAVAKKVEEHAAEYYEGQELEEQNGSDMVEVPAWLDYYEEQELEERSEGPGEAYLEGPGEEYYEGPGEEQHRVEVTVQSTKAEEPAKKGKFRLQSRKIFLTYPQVEKEESKEELIEKIVKREKIKGLKHVVGAKEEHKEGVLHYHFVLSYEKKQDIRDPNYYDYVAGKHGEYKTVRDMTKAIKYVQKGGESFE